MQRKGLMMAGLAAVLAAGVGMGALSLSGVQAQQQKPPAEKAGAAQSAAATQDERTLVQLEPDVRARFLAMMRGFVDSLDDIVNALAEGDFREVERIANDDLGPAHELMARLRTAKVPPEKMAEIRRLAAERMAKAIEDGKLEGRLGMGMIVGKVLDDIPAGLQPGQQAQQGGFGPFLPAEMRVMGMQLHLEGARLAEVAGKAAAAKNPTAEHYRQVMEAMSGITAQCRACHAAWRVW